jgi:hypothetical protein
MKSSIARLAAAGRFGMAAAAAFVGLLSWVFAPAAIAQQTGAAWRPTVMAAPEAGTFNPWLVAPPPSPPEMMRLAAVEFEPALDRHAATFASGGFVEYAAQPPVPPDQASPMLSTDRPLGEAPEDISQYFLRSITVLLAPGEWELDYGLEYLWQDAPTVIQLPDTSYAFERNRLRQLVVPLALRYGLTERIEPYVFMPVGFAHAERSSPLEDEFDTVGGIGDITFGVNYLLREGYDCLPDIILGVSATAPTGVDPFDPADEVASLGNGFWRVSAELNFVRAIDPVVIFGGIGYAHEFEAQHLGVQIQPGEIFFYQFGAGWSVNDAITFSAVFQGAYQGRWEVDDAPLFDSTTEPFTMRFAMTASLSPCVIIEPFVRFGLNQDQTNDSPEVNFGVILTRRF